MIREVVTLAGMALLLTAPGRAQENPIGWGGNAMAEKLSRFHPKPAPGLVPYTPWGTGRDNQIVTTH